MIEDKELQGLAEFSGKSKVLSLYLDTDLAHKSKESIKLTFRERIKNLAEKPSAADVQAIDHFLEFEYDWQARGVAIFVSGQELWRIIPLPISVNTQAFLADKPYVKILTDVIDRFGKYAVALIDRESVRLFLVAGGKIQVENETLGDELKHHRQGGKSAARYQRHTQNLALHNLKQAIEVIQNFGSETGSKHLVLAGTAEVLAEVRDLLPKAVQGQVMGEFVADMEASLNEILARALDVAAEYDLQEERRLVSDVVTAAAKGGAGVIGLADTLYMLHQGRVHQLLVGEHYHVAGYVCASCGYVAAEYAAKCPLCGHEKMEQAADVVEQAIAKAIQTGAGVNIVRENEELTKAGGIAASLRF
jgi:peptide chain release factor subunit 1